MKASIYRALPPGLRGLARRAFGALPPSLRRGRAYRDTTALLREAESWSADRIRDWQGKRLREVVAAAHRDVPGYRSLLHEAGVDPASVRSPEDLARLPFTTKETFRDRLEEFTSGTIPRWKRLYRTTGGSTAVPFGFHLVSDDLERELAFIHHAWRGAGVDPEAPTAVLRGAYVGSPDRPFDFDPAFRELRLSTYQLTPATYPAYRDRLLESRIDVLQAYPSAADLLADLVLEAGDAGRLPLRVLLLGSENLYDAQRERIARAFPGARIHSWYGHAEQVLFAPQCARDGVTRLHFHPLYGMVEFVDDSGRPAGEGEAGELVGTSPWLTATPFLRYRTRDVAVRGPGACPDCGLPHPTVDRIEGRRHEFLLTGGGRLVSMTQINMHNEVFDRVRQFQFHQQRPGAVVLYVARKPGYTDADTERIRRGLGAKLGDDMELAVEFVDTIEPLPSGKRGFLRQELNLGEGRRVMDPRAALSRLDVAVAEGPAAYPEAAPFDPDERYPEYPATLDVSDAPNPAYAAVRNALHRLGLDADAYGTPQWNPLGDVILPGQTVVLKPNFVLSDHYRGGDLFSVITHPAVIRAVADYALLALRGQGRLVIADTPQMDCDFAELLERTRLPAVTALYRERLGVDVPVRDLRNFWFRYENENYVASQENRRPLPGDPEGSVTVDLGRRSAFRDVDSDRFYGADYNRDETVAAHSGGHHRYRMSGTILKADVVLSVPKLKVHKKVGATLNCKGFVGTVTNKNYLIHYTVGSPGEGGDQYPPHLVDGSTRFLIRAQRALSGALLARRDRVGNALYRAVYTPYRALLKPLLRRQTADVNLYDGGNWYGNDSAWRMVADLTRILLFADREGRLHDTPRRTVFSVIDGIVGGEGNGPLFPDPRPEGLVLAGTNVVAADFVAARLMGFDPLRLPWMRELTASPEYAPGLADPSLIRIRAEREAFRTALTTRDPLLGFRPHPGWVGAVEAADPATRA